MSKSLLVSVAAVALAILAGTASAAGTTNKAPLRIANIDPLSGAMGALGTPLLEIYRFEAAQINKAGGINGHKVEIVGFDNQLNPQQTQVQFQKAADEGIHYVIQTISSSNSSALLNAVNKHNRRNPDDPVVYLDPGSVDDAFTNQRCSFWFFRFGANEGMTINTLTDWIAKQKNIHKVFLFNQDYSFGHSVAKSSYELLKKKAPSVKIVGNVFIPLGKVKDFTPYVTQIKASGADTVITGNYGSDLVLLIKAAADAGLDIRFLTYYGDLAGTIKAVGKKGIDRLYVIHGIPGDYAKHPKIAKREVAMYKQTGYDYSFLRGVVMLRMLKAAAEKAHSIDPTKVAFALEGLHIDSPYGEMVMRAKDHQLLKPLFIDVLKGNMKYGLEGTNLGFHTVAKFTAEQTAQPTTCHMRRPKQPAH